MGGVNSARGQHSSFGGGAVVICLGVVHMTEKVETHGKEQDEEHREQTINQPHHMDDHEYGVVRTNTFLSHDVSVHHHACALCRRTMTREVFLSTPLGPALSALPPSGLPLLRVQNLA